MTFLALRLAAAAGLTALLFGGAGAHAQQTTTGQATGGWTVNVQPPKEGGVGQEPAPGQTPQQAAPQQPDGGAVTAQPTDPQQPALDEASLAFVLQVNKFFNDIIHLEGSFVQVAPDQAKSKGKFYVRRPGRLRFDYALPSKLRIVADGRYLSIEDHDLLTVDKYPLESTPFRMLLAQEVDLLRDANIVELRNHDDLYAITLEDKTGESPGRLQLFFRMSGETGELELQEWIITDPQGLDTRIQLADLVRGKEVDTDFFDSSAVAFPTFSE